MSQSDIYELLKNRLLSGDEGYFSAEVIRKMLIDKEINIKRNCLYTQLFQLVQYHYLEKKMRQSSLGRVNHKFYVYRVRKDAI
jgi:hypothetical protein